MPARRRRADGAAVHTMPLGEGADGQILSAGVPADRLEQLHA
jgi:hypothetical protein